MKSFFENVAQLLSVFAIITAGATVTCGGNLFISDSGIIHDINGFFGLSNDIYLGPTILWIIWFGELVSIIILSFYLIFWRLPSMESTNQKIFQYVWSPVFLIIGLPIIILLVWVLLFIYSLI